MIGAHTATMWSAAYNAVAGIGAEPQDLMKMGLDRARSFLLGAEMAIEAEDRVAKAKALSSASSIVEFLLGLSGSEPGELSDRLAKIYHFAMMEILKGNAGDDQAAVAAARIALDELAATWRGIFPDA